MPLILWKLLDIISEKEFYPLGNVFWNIRLREVIFNLILSQHILVILNVGEVKELKDVFLFGINGIYVGIYGWNVSNCMLCKMVAFDWFSS